MRRREFLNSLLAAGLGGVCVPRVARAADERIAEDAILGRIAAADSFGLIVDVQEVFLSHLDGHRRSKAIWLIRDFAHLLLSFEIPIVVTLEKPVTKKGALPKEISDALDGRSETFEKSFFDLTREPSVREYMAGLGRKQVIIAGCETDICVLQSCLGLLTLGYEVYMVEDLLFSGSAEVNAAIARMRAAGAIFVSYRTLFHELAGSVEDEEKLDAGPLARGLAN